MLQGLNQRSKTKVPVVGTASLNLAEFASVVDQKDFDLNIPITVSGGAVESSPSLSVCLSSTIFLLVLLRDYDDFFIQHCAFVFVVFCVYSGSFWLLFADID